MECLEMASRLVALHLGLEALVQGLELVHVSLLCGPANSKTLLFVRLGNLVANGLVGL